MLHFGMLNRIPEKEGLRDGSGTILTEGKARKAASRKELTDDS